MAAQPFKIDIPQAALDDLHARLARTQWPDEIEGSGWDYGTNLDYLKSIVNYWRDSFDWRKQEAALNRFAHFRADVDGFGIHFIHERGKGPNPLPIIITHGWPSSFWEITKLIALLTDPARHGGDPADSFDVVVPSLPGFGFSDKPHQPGMTLQRTGDLWAKLMTDVLGYPRFAASGGDFGSGVTRWLALDHPDLLVGIYLTYLGYPNFSDDKSNLTEAEKKYQAELGKWFAVESAYSAEQSTKPQTLAYGLNDSPVGLAAWIIEKFQTLSDNDGNIEKRFSKDDLLTNVMIYWVTETINSSIRTYRENIQVKPPLQPGQHIEVPAGIGSFPGEYTHPPREWAERTLRVRHWTDMPHGGHFAAFEEPELLAQDIRAFFRPLRSHIQG